MIWKVSVGEFSSDVRDFYFFEAETALSAVKKGNKKLVENGEWRIMKVELIGKLEE